jgi:hypothetical protein
MVVLTGRRGVGACLYTMFMTDRFFQILLPLHDGGRSWAASTIKTKSGGISRFAPFFLFSLFLLSCEEDHSKAAQ